MLLVLGRVVRIGRAPADGLGLRRRLVPCMEQKLTMQSGTVRQ
jgi:hypothetical protein